MNNPVEIRLSKKIVIPIIVILIIIIGALTVKQLIFSKEKNESTDIASEAYELLSGDNSQKVVLRIDGVDVTYGRLMCNAKLYQAYSKSSANEKQNIEASFIDIYSTITQYNEVQRLMKEEPDFKPESEEETKAIMKNELETSMRCDNAKVVGVSTVKYRHIEDDFSFYRMRRFAALWINRKHSNNISDNVSYSSEQLKQFSDETINESKKLIKNANDNGTIEYVDNKYNYLTKSLIDTN